ncbi:Rhodanese-related sulfurtransferase [Candidatus Rhodobacter oscarellae]|uniref:Rhodanese-related sulfurtransferase n=1 Tax=Candidatus Rhodobacter oscarellae TaxID=1675527 RepID=A0A0J9EBA5_9RHOB|nr:rhodanese-like domain-containing protein [Candidatus Rhodobacter lobularis]KMW59926.1 Rhodanese-related sulfurtransferase [Candidatus Rhodobacter lobularis]
MNMLSRRSFLALGGAAILGVGAYTGVQVSRARAETAEVMTPAEALAAAAAGEILLVDIRRPDEWKKTGLGAHAVPIDMRDNEFIARVKAARTSETQPVAVICARGVRSARMTRLLEQAQVGPIVDIPEGMLGSSAGPGWLKGGLPVVQYE